MTLSLTMPGDDYTIIVLNCIECNGEMHVVLGADYSGTCNECVLNSDSEY